MIDAVVLGLFTGLTYGLLAVGLVLVYRSSRFVNFAHGSVGVFGAAVLGKVVTSGVLPYWVAFPLAMAAAGAVAAAIEVVVVRRLKNRPAVTGMIATLGLSQFILIAALLLNSQGLSGLTFPRPPGLPTFTLGRTPIGPAFVAMALLAPVLFGALALLLRRSRAGLGLRAAADAPDMAQLDGVPAARMTTLAWAVAGAVAAFSAILVTPTQGAQSIDTLGPELLLRGLAGAVAARMSSLPRALAACLGIGVAEQVLLSWGAGRGGVSLALALFILVTLLSQPRLGRRDSAQAGWPRSVPLPGTALGRAATGVGLLAAAGLAYLVSNETASVLTTVAGFALVGLSVLLVTGLAGELSLGQFAFAGIGAAVSLHVAAATGNFFTAALAGCAAAAAAAALVGLPALRLRGLALAAVSLAFALAAEGWLLRLPVLLGDGVEAAKPQWQGYPLLLAKDYYLFALLMLGLGLWLAHRLRTGGFGLTVLALRDNEDAAKALAIPATLRKLQVYAAAGVLAGLGGVVIAHGQTQVTVNSFPAAAGIDAVALTVVGGLGVLGGPVLGSLLLVGLPALVDLGIGGQAVLTVGWLLVVVLLPGGLGEPLARLAGRLPSHRRPSTSDAAPPPPPPPSSPKPEPEAPIGDPAVRARWATVGEVAAARARSAAGDADARVQRIRLPRFELPTTAAGVPLLSARAVARSFGGVRAVAGVDLDVAAGEVVGIIGPNGAGKTTLFEILAGFTRPESGRVLLAGHDVTRLPPQRRARRGLGRSFQDARLFPTLTVRESLLVAAERRDPAGLAAAALGATAGARRRAGRTGELLDLFGLAEVADRPVGALSTGTRRTVELACLLALEPALLLLDEPSSGVSQADGVALGELLLRVNGELGVALVVIEHDLPLLARLAPRLVAMESGRVIADGPTASVRAHPAVVASYLGTDPVAENRSGTPV
ncbi:ATP-binding cassette domain-containing protein [Catellatospora sp. KI3]|uniref:ABC transporter permease subunit n=1 Tax=Catellatospora sp. KI3 TaxID=3041620 RepID=UPI0024825995|nr:ATP-binding cassette domain-containing protein [Catellatospora sp. KI3]MDI1463029.1 ATP-binding cassette domain-containing protein [Catellatospora sp. KI3]